LIREFTDIHSHVLPGVDDGAANIEKSLELLRQMEDSGVTDLILTPHYCKRRGYTAKIKDIDRAFKELCLACKRENIGIRLYLGTEMEYSSCAISYIKEGRVRTLADSDYILVEFPPYIKADDIVKATKEILQLGLTPVIAHAERYEKLYRSFDTLYELKSLGAKIQINLRSILCRGFRLKRFLKRVMSENLADYLAGDVHAYALKKDEFKKCCDFAVKHSSEEYLRKLLSENAKKIITGDK